MSLALASRCDDTVGNESVTGPHFGHTKLYACTNPLASGCCDYSSEKRNHWLNPLFHKGVMREPCSEHPRSWLTCSSPRNAAATTIPPNAAHPSSLAQSPPLS